MEWIFSDIGTTNTSLFWNPSYVYSTPTTYSVELTPTDAGGSNTTPLMYCITVTRIQYHVPRLDYGRGNSQNHRYPKSIPNRKNIY